MKNDQLKEYKSEIDYMRNPPNGRFGKFLKDITSMTEAVEELESLHNEKW